jgi:hypothetical protein
MDALLTFMFEHPMAFSLLLGLLATSIIAIACWFAIRTEKQADEYLRELTEHTYVSGAVHSSVEDALGDIIDFPRRQ